MAQGSVIVAKLCQRLVQRVDRVAIVPLLHGIAINRGQGIHKHALVFAVAHTFLIHHLLEFGECDAGSAQAVFGLQRFKGRQGSSAEFPINFAAIETKFRQRLLKGPYLGAFGTHRQRLVVDPCAGVCVQ